MAKYSVGNLVPTSPAPQNIGTSFKTMIGVNASSGTALRRGKLYFLQFGQDGTPILGNESVTWDVSRFTSAGTGVAATPLALDPADSAALTVGTVNYTAESAGITANSSMFGQVINQRASYQWTAKDFSELVWPATNLAGLVLRAKGATSGYASTAVAEVKFEEQ